MSFPAEAPFNACKNIFITQKLFYLADFQLCAKSKAGESFHLIVIHIMARWSSPDYCRFSPANHVKLIVGAMWEGKFSRVFHFPWDALRESEPQVQKPTHSEWTDALRINTNTTHVPFHISSKNAITGSDKWRRLTWAGWVEQPSCGALQPGSAPSPCSLKWSRPLPELRVTIPDNGWKMRLAGRRVARLAMLRLLSHRWSAVQFSREA